MYLPCNNPERFSTISSTDVARWRADLSISRIQFGSKVCAAMVVSRLFGLLSLVKFFELDIVSLPAFLWIHFIEYNNRKLFV